MTEQEQPGQLVQPEQPIQPMQPIELTHLEHAEQPQQIEQLTGEQGGALEDVKSSFSALGKQLQHQKQRMSQTSAHKKLSKQIAIDTATYDDNRNILDNYPGIIQKQNGIIASARDTMAANEEALHSLTSEYSPKKDALDTMKTSHENQLAPLSRSLDNAKDDLESAEGEAKELQDDLSEMQSEVDDFSKQISLLNTEISHETANDMKSIKQSKIITLQTEQSDTLSDIASCQAMLGAAETKVSQKKETVNQLQEQYDTLADEFDRVEEPYRTEVNDLSARIEAKKKQNESEKSSLVEDIEHAKARIAYCDNINKHPERTDALLEKLRADSLTADSMQNDIDAHAHHVQKLKNDSKTATIIVIAGVILLLAIIGLILFIVFS